MDRQNIAEIHEKDGHVSVILDWTYAELSGEAWCRYQPSILDFQFQLDDAAPLVADAGDDAFLPIEKIEPGVILQADQLLPWRRRPLRPRFPRIFEFNSWRGLLKPTITCIPECR
jgi:hypothetical protein